MPFAVARGGPGPGTILYRTSCQVFARTYATRQLSRRPKQTPGSNPVSQGDVGKKPRNDPAKGKKPVADNVQRAFATPLNRNAPNVSLHQRPLHPASQPRAESTIHRQAKEAETQRHAVDEARAAARAVQDVISKLRLAMDHRSSMRVAIHFIHLHDLGAHDLLNPADWAALSRRIIKDLNRSEERDMVIQMSKTKPKSFRLYSLVAVEAAARNHWTGLFRLMMALLEDGLPDKVNQLHSQFRETILGHQGKVKTYLDSWNRAHRLRARVTGDGVQRINLMKIAASTVLNQWGITVIRELMLSRGDWTRLDRMAVHDIKAAISKSSDDSNMSQAFQDNLTDWRLARAAYHSRPFLTHINKLIRQRDAQELVSVYNWAMARSIGPDRYLQPLSLGVTLGSLDDMKQNTTFTLGRRFWHLMIEGFAAIEKPHLLLNLISKDLPARGLQADPELLVKALNEMELIREKAKQERSSTLVTRAEYGTKALFAYCSLHDFDQSDQLVAYKLNISLRQNRAQALEQIEQLRRQPQLGFKTIGAIITSDLRHENVDEALKMLSRPISKEEATQHCYLWDDWVAKLKSKVGRWPVEAIDEALRAGLKLKPDSIQLSPSTWGDLCQFYISQGDSVDDVLQPMFNFNALPANRFRHRLHYQEIEGLTNTYTRRSTPRIPKEILDAAFRTVENALKLPVTDIKPLDLEELLGLYLETIVMTRTKDVSPEMRVDYIARAIGLVTPRLTFSDPMRQWIWVLEGIDRMGKGDGVDIEMLRCWMFIKKIPDISDKWLRNILQFLIRRRRTELAVVVTKDIWNMENNRHDESFWSLASSQPWFTATEIDKNQLPLRQRGRKQKSAQTTPMPQELVRNIIRKPPMRKSTKDREDDLPTGDVEAFNSSAAQLHSEDETVVGSIDIGPIPSQSKETIAVPMQ